MTRILLSFLLVLSLSTARAQFIDLNQGGFAASDYFVELPFEYRGDKIIVEVEVRGRKKKFIMDTGAPLALSHALQAEFGFTPIARQSVTDINQRVDSLLFVRVDELGIGTAIVKDIPAVVLRENPVVECYGVDGFMGSNVLRNSVLQLDYEKRVVRISSALTPLGLDASGGTELMLDQQSSPYLRLRIGKQVSEFALFDSGADDFYTMADQKIDKFIKSKDFQVLARSFGSNTLGLSEQGAGAQTAVLNIPSMIFNNTRIMGVVTETTNDDNSRIGVRLMEYGKLTIDYRGKRYFFQPFENRQVFSHPPKNLGFQYCGDGLCIGKIWSKELEGRIAVGDRVVSVNGKSLEKISLCDAILRSPLKQAADYQLDVRNQRGEIVTVAVSSLQSR